MHAFFSPDGESSYQFKEYETMRAILFDIKRTDVKEKDREKLKVKSEKQ